MNGIHLFVCHLFLYIFSDIFFPDVKCCISAQKQISCSVSHTYKQYLLSIPISWECIPLVCILPSFEAYFMLWNGTSQISVFTGLFFKLWSRGPGFKAALYICTDLDVHHCAIFRLIFLLLAVLSVDGFQPFLQLEVQHKHIDHVDPRRKQGNFKYFFRPDSVEQQIICAAVLYLDFIYQVMIHTGSHTFIPTFWEKQGKVT